MAKHLANDLDRLSREILTLGGCVEEMITKAVAALIERREDLAREVIASDDEVDEREVRVEEECLKILALHQPVAADLRFVIAALKVNNDLERMGDLAANIAARSIYLFNRDPLSAASQIVELATMVLRMVKLSLDSLISRDVRKAREVLDLDDEVDTAHYQMYKILQAEMFADPTTIKRGVSTMSISRNLERIADLSTNIAEDMVFMVEGEVIRHRKPAERAQKQAEKDRG